MDQIEDENGRRLNIEIPYLAKDIQYDGLGWETFPERTGYGWLQSSDITVQEVCRRAASIQKQELQAFVQAWLFFGLLKEVYCEEYRLENFLSASSDGQGLVLSAAKLPENSTIQKSRQLLHDGILQCDVWDAFAARQDASWGALLVTVRLLIDYFDDHWDHSPPRNLGDPSPKPAHRKLLSAATENYTEGASFRLVRERLLDDSASWCTHRFNALCKMGRLAPFLYATGLKRFQRRGVDHRKCLQHLDCVANNVEIGTEIMKKHYNSDCDCPSIEAPSEQRTRILERGGIPVLRCRIWGPEHLDLQFVPVSPTLKYVAISHLWADGLGNPLENSLPRCQILRLITAASNASTSWIGHAGKRFAKGLGIRTTVYIWLDVYCIPAQISGTSALSDEERLRRTRLKAQAIARMATTYALAQVVLVLDQEIENSSLAKRSVRSQALTSLCAWNTRCWTYQEYSFARRAVFQTKDALLPLSSLQLISPRDSFLEPFPITIAPWQKAVKGFDPGNISRPGAFARAWNALALRSTTQWDDMILVLTILLDLSAGHVTQLAPHERMKAIISSQPELPLSLLFAPLDRLGQDSLADRWVPKTFQPVYLSPGKSRDNAVVTENGLRLKVSESYNLKLIRLSLPNKGSVFHCKFQWSGVDRMCWVLFDRNQIKLCQNQLSIERKSRVIFLLDLDKPLLGVDLDIISNGACYLPIGAPKRQSSAVVYVGPIQWGFTEDKIIETGVLSPKEDGINSILIKSDISTWPKLPRTRSRLNRQRVFGRAILLCVCLLVPFIILLVALVPSTLPMLVLLLVILAMDMHIVGHSLMFMYQTTTEIVTQTVWWRQLDAIFTFTPVWTLSWYDWVPAAALKGVIWILKKWHQVFDGRGKQRSESRNTTQV